MLILFPPIWISFLLCLNPEKISPCVWKCLEKLKNVNFIKLAKKRDEAKRKWHTISFFLCPILFKLVSMDGELNFTLETETYFYQKIKCGTYKSSQT